MKPDNDILLHPNIIKRKRLLYTLCFQTTIAYPSKYTLNNNDENNTFTFLL